MQPDGLAAEHHSLAFHWDRQVELVHCIVFMSYQVQVLLKWGIYPPDLAPIASIGYVMSMP